MVITDKNAQTIRRQEVNESQEQYVTAFFDDLRKKSKKIDFDSIEPLGDVVLIKCKLVNSTIVVPGKPQAGSYEWIKVAKISNSVKERHPQLPNCIDKYCFCNLQMLLQLGQGPCYIEDDKTDPSVEYHYYKCQAGHIEYVYEEKKEGK